MTASALLDEDFETVCKLAKDTAAISMGPGKEYLVESRLTKLATQMGMDSISTLVSRIRVHDKVVKDAVIEALTTNETLWFRDVHPFTALKETVLPDVIRRQADRQRLSIWCGASSSGQEPYSLAMTILDGFPHLSSWQTPIVCSDISQEMLERTAAGRYSNLEINRGLPASSLVRWFDRDGRDYIAHDQLRRMLHTRKINLAEPFTTKLTDEAPYDVVFLRNVLIYFDDEDKKAVLAQVRRVMHPDGWFFLGAAETTLNLDPEFERIAVGKTSAYRLKNRPSSRLENP